MKKALKLSSLLLACVLFVGLQSADAQRRGEKKDNTDDEYFDESGGFAHRLWYGGGFNLGFSGSNSTSVFTIGISPMVGYKFTESVSAGPRVFINYSTIKFSQGGRVFKANPVSYGGGLFARAKLFQSIFAHVEYLVENEAFLLIDPSTGAFQIGPDNKADTIRQTSSNFYIGGGYYSGGGGGLGYEIVLLYNLLEPEDSLDLPIDLRFGFTWNF